jgi:protein arginine N-methyltransferase 5
VDPRATDTWHWWNTLRTLCDSNKKIGLVLELSADLPPAEVVDRWCGEPVKALVLPTNIFVSNKKGFPVLSRAHQIVVKKFFKLSVQLILSGSVAGDQQKVYLQYMEHLWQTQEPMDNISVFAKGYEDFLQCPLQPLMDNLEAQTYEVFEKDPIKYSQYQLAIYQALLARVPHDQRDTQTIIVMVLGAGRGPLVTATLRAAESAERNVRVYAVEKNPNAVITLENQKADTWGDAVTIVSGDMRVWDAPERADIIVSELLGSFGDNELSPECLDGAQRFLKDDSVSIPCSYTSYLCPLSSSKLWNEARVCRDPTKTAESYFETPYVVRVHNSLLLDKPQPLFTFTHPTPAARMPTDNNRFGSLQFDIGIDTVLHGFGGYFHCVLYGDVTLGIVPDMHTPAMISWFPMYFPIKEPMYLRRGERLTTHFWRINNGKNVWYEWCITEPSVRPIHNPKGRSYTIGL